MANCQIKSGWQKKFSEWMDFGHKDTIYKLKFGLVKHGRFFKFAKLSCYTVHSLENVIKVIWINGNCKKFPTLYAMRYQGVEVSDCEIFKHHDT